MCEIGTDKERQIDREIERETEREKANERNKGKGV